MENYEIKSWDIRTENAILAISKMKEDINLDISKIENEIDIIQQQISELETTIKKYQNKHDINLNVFSPYTNDDTIKLESLLKEKANFIQYKIPELYNTLNLLVERQNTYNEILLCLKHKKEKNVNTIGLKVIETQEMERQRIARDLHDSTIQNLTSLVHKAELCLKLVDVDTIRTKLELATMTENTKQVINSMRDIIYNLRPMSIQDLGLIPTINKYVSEYMKLSSIQVVFNTNLKDTTLLPIVNLTIYRIIQEACNNILKYAKASACIIELNLIDNCIHLSIEDNGVGIKNNGLSEPVKNTGFGLSIMKERVLLLKGTFEINSYENKGTKILISIPIPDYKGDR